MSRNPNFRVLFLFMYVFLLQRFASPRSETCPNLTGPKNGAIARCRDGNRHMSVCSMVCNAGYELHGISRTLCWCGAGTCGWKGTKPTCKATQCDVPNFDNGRVYMVDAWPRGFAAVMELNNVQELAKQIKTGWSLVMIFDRPLGVNASITSWNTQTITNSYDRQAFTLVNARHNFDLSKTVDTPDVHWLFVAHDVDLELPKAAYVGLYNRRIRDVNCLQAPKMTPIERLSDVLESAEAGEPTESAINETTKPATSPTSVTSPTQETSETTKVTTASTSATTKPILTPTETTPVPLLSSSTTPKTVISIKSSAPKPKKRKPRRRWRKKTTSTTISSTTTSTTTPPTTAATSPYVLFSTLSKAETTTKKKPVKRRPRRRRFRFKSTTKTTSTTQIPTSDPISVIHLTPAAEETTAQVTIDKVGERFCLLQRHEDSYKTQKGWEDDGIPYFSANAILNVTDHLMDWAMLMIFNAAIEEIQVWSCTIIDKSTDGRMWTFGPNSWNLDLYPGESDINFIAKQAEKTDFTPTAQVYLCSYAFLEGDAIVISPGSPAQRGEIIPESEENVEREDENETQEEEISREEKETEDDVIEEKGKPGRWKKPEKIAKRCLPSSPSGIVPKTQGQIILDFKPNTDGTKYNYNEILHKSILFYEAQRAGVLPRNNRIPWRGPSTLKDGCDIGVDLSGGWFDAGDHVKFHFPMAFSSVMLAWGGLMFPEAYKNAGEYDRLKDSIKWPLTYLIKAHISKYEFVGQVGSGHIDHITYGRPEEMKMERPTYVLSPEKPGSEVTAETAAALAAASIMYKKSHRYFAKNALKHAKELYEFAEKFKGNYHNSIPDVKDFYFSYSGYDDELIWGAAWLYKATKDKKYLLKAKTLYIRLGGQYIIESEFSWERKLIGAQILLADLTGEDIYRIPVIKFLDNLLTAKATDKGLYWIRKWGPNRYAANMAFAVMAASTLKPRLPKMDIYIEWAEKQIHLLLGDIGRSYVVGFGKNYPQRVHHRSSACQPFPELCSRLTFYTSRPNYYILHGGLVGGPDIKEVYSDNRAVYEQTEVACDYNAGFQGAVAGLKQLAMEKRKKYQEKYAK